MNGGAATAFLPNFVGFPSLRGPHSSTVQSRRTPGGPGVRLAHMIGARARTRPAPSRAGRTAGIRYDRGARGQVRAPRPRAALRGKASRPRQLPPSAPSAASAAATSAGRTAAAGRRPSPAGVTRMAAGAAGGRPAVPHVPGPPAPRAAAAAAAASADASPRPAAAVRRPPRPVRRRPGGAGAGLGHQGHHEEHCDERQDDADDHGVTLLPNPPKRPPVGASLGAWALRERGMPACLACQSTLEELQSFGAG